MKVLFLIGDGAPMVDLVELFNEQDVYTFIEGGVDRLVDDDRLLKEWRPQVGAFDLILTNNPSLYFKAESTIGGAGKPTLLFHSPSARVELEKAARRVPPIALSILSAYLRSDSIEVPIRTKKRWWRRG